MWRAIGCNMLQLEGDRFTSNHWVDGTLLRYRQTIFRTAQPDNHQFGRLTRAIFNPSAYQLGLLSYSE
ncbi:hypothetical protein [Allocoleopsis sp.]|uniref:hypothetical protein n=1 Tax=Allocoleopsis sp. TaxID=3088169 RepID=UPI002FD0A9B9